MLDDNDFKQIEDFLKTGGNIEDFIKSSSSELQTFQKFEVAIDEFLIKIFNTEGNPQENFDVIHKLMYQCFTEYEQNKDNVAKDFAITIILIKKSLEILTSLEKNMSMNEKDKKMYLNLMKILVKSLKKEAESQLNFFKLFSEYIDDISNSINIEN